MKAVAGPLPAALRWSPGSAGDPAPAPGTGADEWCVEVKWDGMRVLARVGPGTEVRLWSANSIDVTDRFPELAGLAGAVHPSADGSPPVGPVVLDGELVALDGAGRPDFGLLQQRMHAAHPPAAAVDAVPLTYVVFDVLDDGHGDVTSDPLEERTGRLGRLVEPGPHWFRSPVHPGTDAAELLEAAQRLGLEGIVVKRRSSRYHPGRRSPDWVKVKVRASQELLVGGWLEGTGGLAGALGSLVVGYRRDDGTLALAGRVGSGIDERARAELTRLLAPLGPAPCPFEPPPRPADAPRAHWVDPRLVVQVGFAHWTADGRLRHPVYEGWREDRDPADVRREPR